MPTYEYQCSNGHIFEVIQKISDLPLEVCTEFGCEEPVKKLISATGFVLKGGGWTPKHYA